MTRRYANRWQRSITVNRVQRAVKRKHPPDANHVRILSELDAAIWASDCPYCGAIAGAACRQKPRGDHPPTSTKTAHMDRVRAGHARLKATSK